MCILPFFFWVSFSLGPRTRLGSAPTEPLSTSLTLHDNITTAEFLSKCWGLKLDPHALMASSFYQLSYLPAFQKKIPNSKEYREALFKEHVCLQVEQICQLIMAIHPHTGHKGLQGACIHMMLEHQGRAIWDSSTTLSLWGWNQCQSCERHTKYKLTRKQALEQAQRRSFTSRSNGNTEPLLCHSLHTHLM